MSFFAGNRRTLYFATQSVKGTPLTTPTVAMRVTDFTPNDVRQKIRLAETDRTTQQPPQVVVGNTPGFSFKTYLRPSQVAFLIQAVLGDNTDSGSDPNYIHTIVPDPVVTPYLTMFEAEPDVWCNRHADIRVTQLQLDIQDGGVCEATVTCEALGFLAGATEPDLDAGSELPYVWPEIAITRATVHPGTASQATITIARNGQRANGDTGFNSIDYVNGLFAVTGQITKYASDDADRRQVDTGSKTGTAPTTAIYDEALSIKLTRDANTSVEFQMAAVSYPTNAAAVNTDGSPLAEVLGFETVQQTDIADNLTVVVKDAAATPDG